MQINTTITKRLWFKTCASPRIQTNTDAFRKRQTSKVKVAHLHKMHTGRPDLSQRKWTFVARILGWWPRARPGRTRKTASTFAEMHPFRMRIRIWNAFIIIEFTILFLISYITCMASFKFIRNLNYSYEFAMEFCDTLLKSAAAFVSILNS